MHAPRLVAAVLLSLMPLAAPALEWSLRGGPLLADRPGPFLGDAWRRVGVSAAAGVALGRPGARWHPRLEVGYAHLPVNEQRIREIMARSSFVVAPATSAVGVWSAQAGLRFNLPWPPSGMRPFLLAGAGYMLHRTNGEDAHGIRAFMGSDAGPFLDLGGGFEHAGPGRFTSFVEGLYVHSALAPGNYVSRFVAVRGGIVLR